MIAASELIISEEGRVYHLDLLPSDVATKVILVGDPARVSQVATFFDTIECDITHREFHTITGTYKGKRISAMSTGISSDNVDILITELDALFNVDFATREIKSDLTSLDIVRLGTCGALQDDLELGDFILSRYSMGLDGLVNFYLDSDTVRCLDIERRFVEVMQWSDKLPYPYVVKSSDDLADRMSVFCREGFTACAGGFFGPQGRTIRLRPMVSDMVDRISEFEYDGKHITNFEMEGAAVMAMSLMLGHRAVTACVAVAHRKKHGSNINYTDRMNELIVKTLAII